MRPAREDQRRLLSIGRGAEYLSALLGFRPDQVAQGQRRGELGLSVFSRDGDQHLALDAPAVGVGRIDRLDDLELPRPQFERLAGEYTAGDG
jgi:hypothetical protein